MKALVIGGSGLVGNNCLRVFGQQEGVETLGTYYSYKTHNTVFFDTLDLNNPDNASLDALDPELIIHCGALTHVDYCEAHERESYAKTVGSALNAIHLAKFYKARMVYISTDYVFDGKAGPYGEDDAVNPLSVYARHKLEAEQAVLREIGNSLIIRITNVYGDEERNKNFVTRIAAACMHKETLELKLPVDQYATPVNAYDVARAIYLLARDQKSGVYNIASTDFLNRVELVEKILGHFPGHKITYKPVTTAELGQAAPRPLKGGLKTEKFMHEYPDFIFSGVDNYLLTLRKN